ncbi:ABC transporter substrate-binding protein [Chelativorans sp. AA-79]|uniref:ABC transporter substrate-binding protein n=1 Tax=Chelativorans sp. AA-79 TaxID=3028735 RepID=UPI0023F81DE7|nr:ABC transporter substrate-binding protein [Chelativorans sp. AA-79]WEX09110.1 ABC transporter substrate-binding protein [Chelativorans sp. AA-79]
MPGILRAQNSNDVIRIALSAGGPRKVDPNQTTQGADNWSTEQMFEQLVRPPDGLFAATDDEYVPTLATSWETSDDGRTWVFQIRQGVQFHKGYGEMTAEDVVHSFNRARFDGVSTAVFTNIEDVQATGAHEVTFKLKGPDPLFLGSTVFQNAASIVSKKADEEKGESFHTDSIGTGPYHLDRFDIENGVYMSRHEDYWGEPAKVPRIECVYIADTTARTLALISGEVDIIEAVRAPGWIDQIKQRDSSLLVDMTNPGSFMTIHINLTAEPFDNPLVRKAIATAIDTEVVANALAPMGRPTYTLSPPHYPTGWAHEDLPEELRYDYNPDRARELLAEAGHPNGIQFEANTSQREDYRSTMLIVQELMRPAGIDMQLNIMDHSAYHGSNRQDQNTLALHSASYPPVPLDYMMRYLSSGAEVKADGTGGGNYSHYGVAMPGVDDMLEGMQLAKSFDEYVEIGRKIELKLQDDLPVLGVNTLGYTTVRSPRVDLGYEVNGGYARWRFHKATKS